MALLTGAPRGTKDVTPDESYKWQYVEGILRETAREFGFSEIRFPTFEHTELFIRSVGDTTDVVQKEMYTFLDKGGRSVTLRPEGTASVVRSFAENALYGSGLPVKVYYIAPNFRYEKPQAGRLREHHQFGVEYFGSERPEAEAEVIGIADTYLKRLGLTGLEVQINSIGCRQCRPGFHQKLKEYFRAHQEELCPTCLERLERNPLRILDCKNESCARLAAEAPVGLDFLCPDCRDHFEQVQEFLTAMGISFTVNPQIVRGLDYYIRTVFEFVSNEIGAQGTVCGGGRYDGLVGSIGGKDAPGIGFGSGIERLLLVMEARGVEIPRPRSCDLFVAALGEAESFPVQKLVMELRRAGLAVERDTMGRGLKAQMKYAGRIGTRFSCVVGSNELEQGVIKMKDMDSGVQTDCPLEAGAILSLLQKETKTPKENPEK
ncbi:MAG: histidine--tRNA ligase [Oscillospiraceae bacterium]|nr:histidine--tRNA ligase [Oscillospiraceae bacterium]